MRVTLVYAGLLAAWFVALSLRVIAGRVGPGNPSLGDGGNPAMLRRIRAHANFAEYVPLTLLLIGLLEFNQAPEWQLHALGSALLVGRLLHGYALSFTLDHPFGRTAGIALTLLALSVASVLCVIRFLGWG